MGFLYSPSPESQIRPDSVMYPPGWTEREGSAPVGDSLEGCQPELVHTLHAALLLEHSPANRVSRVALAPKQPPQSPGTGGRLCGP